MQPPSFAVQLLLAAVLLLLIRKLYLFPALIYLFLTGIFWPEWMIAHPVQFHLGLAVLALIPVASLILKAARRFHLY